MPDHRQAERPSTQDDVDITVTTHSSIASFVAFRFTYVHWMHPMEAA
jgi:hypothetical protein